MSRCKNQHQPWHPAVCHNDHGWDCQEYAAELDASIPYLQHALDGIAVALGVWGLEATLPPATLHLDDPALAAQLHTSAGDLRVLAARLRSSALEDETYWPRMYAVAAAAKACEELRSGVLHRPIYFSSKIIRSQLAKVYEVITTVPAEASVQQWRILVADGFDPDAATAVTTAVFQ